MKNFLNDISLQFSQLKANIEELVVGVQDSYLFLKNTIELVSIILNWFGFSVIVVLLLSFAFFRIFNFVYPYSKLLNVIFALASVFALWFFFNIHFYKDCSLSSFASLQNCHLTMLLQTFLFIFSILFFLWFLQFLLQRLFKSLYKAINKKATKTSLKIFSKKQPLSHEEQDFFYVLDQKNWELKESYRLGNKQKSKEISQEIQNLLKDYLS